MVTQRQRSALIAFGLSTAFLHEAASAQTSSENDDSGEIIVTAQKKSSTVQTTPVAITAINGADFDGSRGSSLASLEGRVPGFVLGDSIGVPRLTLRGVSTENVQGGSIGGDPGVAFSLNGVGIARPAGIPGELYDIERIEVLRGPQGTLYGRSATGGAINVIARGATDTFTGYAEGLVGNLSRWRLRAAIGGPIAEGVGFRIAGFVERQDGFIRNIVPTGDQDIGNRRHFGLRGSLKAALGERITAKLFVDYYRRNNATGAYYIPGGARPEPTPQEALGGVFAPGPRSVAGNPSKTLDYARLLTAGAELEVDLGGATLTSITGFQRSRTNAAFDIDGTTADYANLIYRINRATQYSEELRLAGRSERLDWIIGGYLFSEKGQTDQAFDFIPFGGQFRSGGHVKTQSLALFGQADFKLLPELKLTGGLRWTRDRKKGDEYFDFFGATSQILPRKTWSALTPRIAIEYRPDPNILTYVSATRGFKSGGFNIGALQGPYSPETIWSYEAGVKAQFLDRRLTTNISVFRQDYKDQQFTQILGVLAILTNAGQSRAKGIEIETSYRPTDNLRFGLTYSYLDARFSQFLNLEDPFPELGVQNLAGKLLPRAPHHTLNVSSEIGLGSIGDIAIKARGDVNYTSRVYLSEFNRRSVSQAPVALVNGSLNWEGDRYYGSLFVRNLTNRTVRNNMTIVAQVIGYAVITNINQPRQFGAEFGVRF
jgi:iron complex outermembrane receptor protein